jgi:hypothetical protein
MAQIWKFLPTGQWVPEQRLHIEDLVTILWLELSGKTKTRFICCQLPMLLTVEGQALSWGREIQVIYLHGYHRGETKEWKMSALPKGKRGDISCTSELLAWAQRDDLRTPFPQTSGSSSLSSGNLAWGSWRREPGRFYREGLSLLFTLNSSPSLWSNVHCSMCVRVCVCVCVCAYMYVSMSKNMWLCPCVWAWIYLDTSAPRWGSDTRVWPMCTQKR